ncbi:MAG: efflux RND transporter periplasmic adaptor subunit [Roseovarius indicus]
MSVWKQLLVLCLLGGLAYGGWEAYTIYLAPTEEAATERASPPAPVELVPAERRVLAQSVEAVGTTRARQSVEIVPEADGRVVEITFTPGDRVAKGEVLVRLDETIQRADLTEAAARSTEQEQALSRARQLRETNAISQATLEDTIARLAEAGAQLDRARRRLDDRTIKAPFAGVVGLTEIDPGARVSEGDIITRLDDLSEVIVEFALPETLFAQVRTGLGVTATSAAFPDRTFEGRIEAVDSRIDPVSRAFRTRAVIPNRDSVLPAGMFMSLTLTLSEAEALVVPEAAIIFQAAETYVFTVTDDIATRVPVKTGQRRGGYVAIEGGLEEGTGVVVRGLQRVRDGGAVTVLDAGDTSDSSSTEGDS